MILNTILMHGLRENKTGRFYWLTQPLKRKVDYHEFYEISPIMDHLAPVVRSQIKCCEHENNCDSYILGVNKKLQILKLSIPLMVCFLFPKGVRRYFKFGMGLEIARTIIYDWSAILGRPLTIFNIFAKRLNWNLILLLVGYVGIYRVSRYYPKIVLL